MKKNRAPKRHTPSADIILDLLNDVPDSPDEIIRHYDHYINAAAKEPLYNETGEHVGTFVNEDLAQEIRMAVLRCLPTLRRTVHRKFFSRDPVVVIIAPIHTHE